jgi:branched-chain amino acid aminotransferase
MTRATPQETRNDAGSETRYAFFHGEFVPIDEAKVSIMTSTFNYGTGVFEGIRAYWSADEQELYIFRLAEHYERFLRNSRFLLLDLPHSVADLVGITTDLLRRNGFRTDVYIRPLAYKSDLGIGVRLHNLESACAIFTLPFGEYIDRPEGAKLMCSSWRRVADNAIPARGKIIGAYVNSALAKSEAHMAGFDDAVMLTGEGHVSEASAANLFLVRHGKFVTPPETDDILIGVTRETVMILGKDLGLETQVRSIDRSELYEADEIFLCGTGVGIVPVTEIDRRPIGGGSIGSVGKRLRELYLRCVRGELPQYREWLTPVYHAERGAGR